MSSNNGGRRSLGKVRGWQVHYLKHAEDADVYEVAVAFAISSCLNESNTWAISTDEIARRARVDRKTASNRVQRLKRRGWIGQKRRKHTTPVYSLLDPTTNQEIPSEGISKNQEIPSHGSRNPVPGTQEIPSGGTERFLEERILEERMEEHLSSLKPDRPEVLAEEIVSGAVRREIPSEPVDLLDVLEAASLELLGGERNGYADWVYRSVTYDMVLDGLDEVSSPSELRDLLDDIRASR